jgi:hypothetical protein
VIALEVTVDLSGAVTSNSSHTTQTVYIGVTPGSSHKLKQYRRQYSQTMLFGVQCGTHNDVRWVDRGVPITVYIDSVAYRISWSPEINTHIPDIKDY